MTLERLYTLEDVIDEALEATDSAPTPDVVHWILTHHPEVIDGNQLTLNEISLGVLVREHRKKKKKRVDAKTLSRILTLFDDLGLDPLEVDDEISIPLDPDDILYGKTEWRDLLEDATANDVWLHMELLKVTSEACLSKRDRYDILRQKMVIIGNGRTDIPMHQLREMAQE